MGNRLKLRVGKPADIRAVLEILDERFPESPYVDRSEIDKREVQAICMQAVQRHGLMSEGGMFFAVAEHNGKVVGFILGVMQRINLIGKHLEATDILWVSRKGAPSLAATRLYRAFIGWAKSVPQVIEIKSGVSMASGRDHRAAGRLLKGLGFHPFGEFYVKEISHEQSGKEDR